MAVAGCDQKQSSQRDGSEQPECKKHIGRSGLRGVDGISAIPVPFVSHQPDAQGGARIRAYPGGILPSAVFIGKRKILRFLLRRMRPREYNLKHMLVVDGGDLARRYVANVQAEPSLDSLL